MHCCWTLPQFSFLCPSLLYWCVFTSKNIQAVSMIHHTSVCTEQRHICTVPQHREPLVPSLDTCDWEGDLVGEVLTWWQTTDGEKRILREVVPVTSSLSAASRAGTGTALLCTLPVLPYCHSLCLPHQNSQITRCSKGKYIQYKFLRVWRVA